MVWFLRRPLIALVLMLAAGPGLVISDANGARAQSGIDCAGVAPAQLSAATPAVFGPPVASIPPEGGALTVFAAASLTDAFERIGATLESAHPHLSITFNFAASQALVIQLEQGAAADVFASANLSQMAAAEKAGVIATDPVVFVRNTLVIVVPASNPANISQPSDLAGDAVKLVLANAQVPAGRYAREAICFMGDDSATNGSGFVDQVAANIVSEEEDVRTVLTKVELGEADAGIVYVTDALAGGELVRQIAIPPAVNRIADYPVAAVAGGDEALAEAFIAYLVSNQGQAGLTEFGFAPAHEGP